MLKTIAEHTVLMPLFGTVIDIGCLGWDFALGALAAGAEEVLAVDPAVVTPPPDSRIRLWRAAAVGRPGQRYFLEKAEPKGSCLEEYDWDSPTVRRRIVPTITLDELHEAATRPVSVLKMDCEGAEIELLESVRRNPFPAQVSVEFHLHTCGVPPDFAITGYRIVRHECWERRGKLNYWDTLLVKHVVVERPTYMG